MYNIFNLTKYIGSSIVIIKILTLIFIPALPEKGLRNEIYNEIYIVWI